MAKASINTGDVAQPVHTRTTAGTEESQAVVVGIDGSDSVVGADVANGLDVDVTRVQGVVHVDDNSGSLTVDGTVAVSGTVPVTQSTSPWVTQDTTATATPVTGTLPTLMLVVGGCDGINTQPLTVRTLNGLHMLQTADQQVRQELEHIRLLLAEQTGLLRQLLELE